MSEKFDLFVEALKKRGLEFKVGEEEGVRIISTDNFLATIKGKTLYFLEYLGKDSKVPVLDITEKLGLNLFVPNSLHREKYTSLRDIFIKYIQQIK